MSRLTTRHIACEEELVAHFDRLAPEYVDTHGHRERLLAVYARAGGKDAAILFHNAADGRELVARLARRGKGLPARVIPLEVFHIASVGMDTMLGALAYGASQVLVLAGDATTCTMGRPFLSANS